MTNHTIEILKLKKYARLSPLDEAIEAIDEIARYRSRRAIRALASLMKLGDARGDAAMYAVIDIGVDAEEWMLGCLESADEDQAWRAQQVLSAIHGEDVAA
jgi:hypothetical protein